MNPQSLLKPAFVDPFVRFEFGTPRQVPLVYEKHDQEWTDLKMDLNQLLPKLVGRVLAEQLTHDFSQARMPYKAKRSRNAAIAQGYEAASRKLYIELLENNQSHRHALKVARLLVRKYLPHLFANNYNRPNFPKRLLVGVKGTGYDYSVTTTRTFKDELCVMGYGAQDRTDAFLSLIINYCGEIDGQYYQAIPSRFTVGTCPISSVILLNENTEIDLSSQDPIYDLATGKNQLSASLIIELAGPDLSGFVLTADKKQLSKVRQVNEVRSFLDWHPFFADLFEKDYESVEAFLYSYVDRMMLNAYFFSRLAAQYWYPGTNRTLQNTGLDGLPRDFDDSNIWETPLEITDEKYWQSFNQHLFKQWEIILDFANLLGLNDQSILHYFTLDKNEAITVLVQRCVNRLNVRYP